MEYFANDLATTLNGTITSGATTLVVADATGMPSTGNFRIRIDSELMLCTSRSGTTLTVTRGVESTTAAAHTTGATVTLVLTNAGIDQAYGGDIVLVQNSAAFAVTGGGALFSVTFDTDLWDPLGSHSTSASTHLITIQKRGFWMFIFSYAWEANATGVRHAELILDNNDGGGAYSAGDDFWPVTAVASEHRSTLVSHPAAMLVGGTAYARVQQNSGSTLNITATRPSLRMAAIRVGDY